MKVYNLRCELHHAFEGWFASEQDFLEQHAAGRIACPLCDSSTITRTPSAPRVRKTIEPAAAAAPSRQPQQQIHEQIQRQVMAMMRELVARTEDVGERFAEEARRIHYEETPERAIRGTASREECEALVDEGIAVLPLPAGLDEPLH